jgi:hypothetical protein
VARAIEAIRKQVPACCRTHPIAELGEPALSGSGGPARGGSR